MKKRILSVLGICFSLYVSVSFNSGCAQIGAPTGGVKDTLAPVLVRASPDTNSLNFRDNRITLVFNEYVEVQDIQNNILVSPIQKINPNISNNLKTITIKLRDTLLPNTTYSINFGNAIKDINEGNIYPNFTYVFSTGNTIDSLTLGGKVVLAESGLPDSTLSVLLYRDTEDSAVQKTKPNYMAKLKGDGSFRFNNLPAGEFRVYALKDGDGGKTYNAKTELFAYLDTVVTVSEQDNPVTLFAYAEEKSKPISTTPVLRPSIERKLRYSSNLSGSQDLLQPLVLTFNNRLKVFDTSLVSFTDTNHIKIANATPVLDSTQKLISFKPIWKPGEAYLVIINKDALADSTGNKLSKNDTIRFVAKTEADYGRIILRFKNYDPGKNPVLQFISNETIKFSFPLTGAEFTNKRFPPGDYELRILFDNNKDGVWTPGNYTKKIQPEKAITLPQKLSIRADWDNERDITL
jgi:hypothetical protein